MTVRYVLAPVVWKGPGLGWFPDIDRSMFTHGHRFYIVQNPDGSLRVPWALCEIDAADWTVLGGVTRLAVLDDLTDTTVLSTQQRTRAQAALNKLGIAVTVTTGDTLGTVLNRVIAAAGWVGRRK